jgi:hypothetical protein
MTWTEEMKAMSNDMKIIELHWLHRVGVRSLVKDYEFRELFTERRAAARPCHAIGEAETHAPLDDLDLAKR